MDEDVTALDAMVEKKQIRWRQLCDGKGIDGQAPRAFHFGGNTPYFYLIDAKGKIAASFRFATEAEEHLQKALPAQRNPDAYVEPEKSSNRWEHPRAAEVRSRK